MMTQEELQKEILREVLKGASPPERWVIFWQFGLHGGFETALAKAISLADDANLERLSAGFPTQVAGFRLWITGDIAKRLRERGLDI